MEKLAACCSGLILPSSFALQRKQLYCEAVKKDIVCTRTDKTWLMISSKHWSLIGLRSVLFDSTIMAVLGV